MSAHASLARRGFLFGAAGVATAALPGCGVTGDDAASGHRPGYPVTVPGKLGSTTLDAPPEQVVAAGYLRDIDIAIALGANLVGAVKNIAFPSGLAPWQRPTTKPQLLDGAEGMPWERIAALNPDLILASDDYELAQNNARLRRIAPTLGYRNGPGKDSWEEMIRRAGKLFGKQRRADELVTDVRDQILDARRAHPELAGKTFTFGPVLPGGQLATISRETDASATFFRQLGMRLSPKVTALPSSGIEGRSNISAEQLDVIDADIMLITYTSDHVRAQFEDNPLFRRLSAVRRGAYIPLDMPTAISVAFPSVLSIPYGLNATVPKLAAAAS